MKKVRNCVLVVRCFIFCTVHESLTEQDCVVHTEVFALMRLLYTATSRPGKIYEKLFRKVTSVYNLKQIIRYRLIRCGTLFYKRHPVFSSVLVSTLCCALWIDKGSSLFLFYVFVLFPTVFVGLQGIELLNIAT